MKVIFLDVDGVLNEMYSKSRAPSGVIGVDDDKIERLGEIVDATKAVVVLSSTWQKSWKADGIDKDGIYLKEKLEKRGITIVGITGKCGDDRGQGIHEYILDDITSWIVIDDEIFPDYPRYGIMPRLVHTSFLMGGLQDKHVEQAIALLNEVDK